MRKIVAAAIAAALLADTAWAGPASPLPPGPAATASPAGDKAPPPDPSHPVSGGISRAQMIGGTAAGIGVLGALGGIAALVLAGGNSDGTPAQPQSNAVTTTTTGTP